MKILSKILNLFRKPKIEPPSERAIVKISDIAKEKSVYDNENKIIEIHRNGKIITTKYSDSDVDALRNQGIPVLEEEYSEDFEFIEGVDFGSLKYKK